MKALFVYLPAFACLAMAVFICLPMLLKRGKHEPNPEIAELREEVTRLKAKVALRDDEVAASDG